jgi:uncharacterized RDD family membrane protein YckC
VIELDVLRGLGAKITLNPALRGTAGPPSWVRASLRWVMAYAPAITAAALDPWSFALIALAWVVTVYLIILWNRNGQGLHDRVANTYVIRTARGEPHLIAPLM